MALDVNGSIGATPLGRTDASAPTVLWILDERPAWTRDGSCREHPEVDFFAERGGSLEPAARRATCLVRDERLAFALEHDEPDGVCGGLSPRERQALRRQRLAG